MDLPATNVGRTKLPSVAIHLFQAGAIITNMISLVFNFLSSHFIIITITTMIDITITTMKIPRKECDMQYTITTTISSLFIFSSSPPPPSSPPSSSSPPYQHQHQLTILSGFVAKTARLSVLHVALLPWNPERMIMVVMMVVIRW